MEGKLSAAGMSALLNVPGHSLKKERDLQLPFEWQLNSEHVAFIILRVWINLFVFLYSIKVHM